MSIHHSRTNKARDPLTIYDVALRAAGTFNCDFMVDYRDGRKFSLQAISTLDQAVAIQMVGNQDGIIANADDINGPIVCTAGGSTTIGLAPDDWMPYIGCRIVAAVAPGAGRLTIRAVQQT